MKRHVLDVRVWEVGSIGDWVPGIGSVVVEGQLRHVTFADGRVQIERILRRENLGRSYSYSYVSGPLPLAHYEARLAVSSEDAGSRMRRVADLAGVPGTDDEHLCAVISRAYWAALSRLSARLSPR